MKDFDVDRIFAPEEARTFRFAGQELVVKPRVSPDIVAKVVGARNEDYLPSVDALMEVALDGPENLAKWKAIRDPQNPATPSLVEMDTIAGWILEVTSGRPIESSSGSSDSPATTGTSSTDTSASTEEQG